MLLLKTKRPSGIHYICSLLWQTLWGLVGHLEIIQACWIIWGVQLRTWVGSSVAPKMENPQPEKPWSPSLEKKKKKSCLVEVSIFPIHIHFFLSCHWTPLRTIPLHLLSSHHQSSSTSVRVPWASSEPPPSWGITDPSVNAHTSHPQAPHYLHGI